MNEHHVIPVQPCVRVGTACLRKFARVSLLAGAASIAGCGTNPIVRWDSPQTADVPDYTLAYGITYANRARDAYRAAIQSDTKTSQSMGSGLIGLGAAIAGLAIFHSHRDAILGTTLLGGTALGLGYWSLSKQRLLVYQAGVAGINCSIEAVLPLYITVENLKGMGLAVDEVDARIRGTVSAIDALNKVLEGAKADDRTQAEQAISDAQSVITTGRASALSARQFMRAAGQAGPQLVAAVDRISNVVDKAVLDTLPDLSAVPKVVSGLAGLAGSFAPGSGVEAAFTAALKAVTGQSESAIRRPPLAESIDKPIKALRAATADLAGSVSALNGRLAGYDTAANTSRLADCGVTGIDSALKVTQSRIEVKAATESTNLVRVSGGASTVYSGAFLKQAEGLTVKNPLPCDRTFQIITTKSLSQTGDFPLLISDAAGKEITVLVVVGAAAGDGAGSAPSDQPVDKAAAAKAFVDWKKGKGDLILEMPNVKVTLNEAKLAAGDNVEMAVSCAPPPAVTQPDLRKKFGEDFQTKDFPVVMTALSKGVTLTFKADGDSCLKAGDSESRVKKLQSKPTVEGREMSVADIQGVQRSLCLAEDDIKKGGGAWGPKTRSALEAWRKKAGKRDGPLTVLMRDEFDALAGGKQQAQCAK